MSTKVALKYFSDMYYNALDLSYTPIYGRDMKILKGLLEDLDLATLQDLIDEYFSTDEGTYSVPFFKVRINDLQQRLKKKEQSDLDNFHNPESWRYDVDSRKKDRG